MAIGTAAPNLLFVAGEWTAAATGKTMEIVDPATGIAVDRVPIADREDIERALAAAEEAWRTWAEVDAWSRASVVRDAARLIQQRTEEFAHVLTEEQGKPLREARAEVLAAAETFDWYADEARRIYGRVVPSNSTANRIFVLRQPIGPVAAFTPWNFPAVTPARKIAPAIAAGCSIILKPAEETPRTALCLAQACEEAGLPPGVVNVVTGYPADISEQLISSDRVRKVTLTGSVPVGRQVLRQAAEALKPVTLELGGHAPVLVFRDADVDQAVSLAVEAKFRNAGQVCIAPSRFIVEAAIIEEFTQKLIDSVRSLRVGPGTDPETDMGPLANRRRLEAVERLVEDALLCGAKLETGGQRPPHLGRGFFYEPTVLSHVDASMEVTRCEPFGPIAPIFDFADQDEGVALANASPYGLAGYLFTRDLRRAHRVTEQLEVGIVGVNNLVVARPEAPFGGIKLSGFGRENGPEGVEAFTTIKYANFLL